MDGLIESLMIVGVATYPIVIALVLYLIDWAING